MNNRPPHIATKFLEWFCDPMLLESIQGDLEEQFEEDLRAYGHARANRRFNWTVARFFRPRVIKIFKGTQKLNFMGMLKNDLKTSLRVIKRDKVYSGINILGLTAGMVIALLILFYARFELSYEDYNPNADRVVRITMDYLDGETLVDQDCETYHVLGPMIHDEFPEVKDHVRAFGVDGGTVIKARDEFFREERVYAVDPSFFDVFGYDLIHGDKTTALTNIDEVVLTKSLAIKYFGRTDVVGETVGSSNFRPTMKVVGVMEDPPATTHLKFDFLYSYATIEPMLAKREGLWNQNDTFTYLLLESEDSYPAFQANLAQLSDRLRAEDHIPDERIISQMISDIHLYSHKSYEAEPNGEATIVYFLLGVALLVIIIAIINYINLSTARSMERAKEAGIRKVIGSSLAQLRIRFFLESATMNAFAGLLTLAVIGLFYDSFRSIAGLPESLRIHNDAFSWGMFGGLLLVSIILSGSFPAFVISSFKPVAVLKGKFTTSKKGTILRKALVVFQFAIAIFLLVQTFTANEQLKYLQNRDLGLNADKVLVVYSPPTRKEMDNLGTFKKELMSMTDFSSVALSTCIPGKQTSDMGSTTNINLVGDDDEPKNNFFIYAVDSSFMETLEMEFVAGTNISMSDDAKYPIIVNEAAADQWGIADLDSLVGRKADFWGRQNKIVGVIKNFHQTGLKTAHIPMIFFNGQTFGDYLSIRLKEGNVLQQIDRLEDVYHSHFPNSPFDFFFLDQEFDAQFREDRQVQQIFGILSGFAVLITCLGLFGLASFLVTTRAKEIGIRKVLGASVSQIIGLLSRGFVSLVIISSLIALPLTWYLVQNWLDQYAFRIELSPYLFIIPSLAVLIIAFVTVFSRTLKISTSNPVESLRDE